MKINVQVKEEGGIRRSTAAIPEWWAVLPGGERNLLGALARILRSARTSDVPELARAGIKRERALGCFIKVRLITEKQRAESRKLK
jgi:hypothetical protein